jgi:hypothetical protein
MKKIVIFVFLIVFVASLSAIAKIDEKTIMGIWTLDEGEGKIASDSSGKGNDGDITGASKWVDGKYGKALEFTGGKVEVSHKEEFNLQTFSMMAWINIPKIISPHQMIISKEVWPNRNYSMWLLPDKVNIGVTVPADTQVASAAVVVDKKWHHVAATFDMKTLKILVDGAPSGQVGLSSKPLNCVAPFTITATEGTLDEVCLFNVGLSDDDVKNLFDNGIKQFVFAVEAKGKLATTWAALRK